AASPRADAAQDHAAARHPQLAPRAGNSPPRSGPSPPQASADTPASDEPPRHDQRTRRHHPPPSPPCRKPQRGSLLRSSQETHDINGLETAHTYDLMRALFQLLTPIMPIFPRTISKSAWLLLLA